MSMNTTRIVTFWNTGEAHLIIEFLDILRDQLLETYGEQIIAMRIEAQDDEARLSDQYTLEFDDDIPF